MAILFKGDFNTTNGDAAFGKIRLYVDTDNNNAGDAIEFKIVDPTGVVIRDYPGTPDYTIPGSPPGGFVLTVTEDIPKSAGDWIRGTYTLYAEVNPSAGPDVIYSETFLFDPANDPNGDTVRGSDGNYIGILTAVVDCRTAEVTFTDDTDNDGWTVDSRLITVQYPPIPGEVTPADETTTDEELVINFDFTNVTYDGTLVTERSKTTTGTNWEFTQEETVEAATSAEVDCGRGICDILPCIDSRFESAYNKACQNGGWTKVPATELATLTALINMSTLYYLHSECGDYERAATYKTRIDQITGGDCGCGCSGSTTSNSIPLPYTPSNGAASNVIIE